MPSIAELASSAEPPYEMNGSGMPITGISPIVMPTLTNTWNTIIAGSRFGEVLIPFDAERSTLIELAEHRENDLTSEEIDLVRQWIEQGDPVADLAVVPQGGGTDDQQEDP